MILLKNISKTIDRLNLWVGTIASWLNIALILTICYYVAFRPSQAMYFELQWYFFATIFLLGAGFTLQNDGHVRVDVFYQRWSAKGKAWVNILGTLLFLVPFCIVLLEASLRFVSFSYSLGETSAQPGGLPYTFIIKAMISLGAFFLLLQGISLLLKSILVLLGESEELTPTTE